MLYLSLFIYIDHKHQANIGSLSIPYVHVSYRIASTRAIVVSPFLWGGMEPVGILFIDPVPPT